MSILETSLFARKVLDHLVAHPEEHNQNSFGSYAPGCGTTMCIAGTACVMDPDTKIQWLNYDACDKGDSISPDGSFSGNIGTVVEVAGQYKDIEPHAASLLGLKYDYERIFYEFDSERALEKFTAHVEGLEAQAVEEMSA